jgi:DNA repair photolyase
VKPIYEPKGKAKEYGDLAINIYTGCPHRCFYCFAPRVLHMDKETFHSHVEPRKGIVEAVQKQIASENITGKLIHLCFTCDPYPTGYDTTPTREIIKILKASGNHVQILTKGNGCRDFDLLDGDDWYGITFDGDLENMITPLAFGTLREAHKRWIKTWVSFEPVLNVPAVLREIEEAAESGVDKVKIGKLNYYPSDIDWAEFGRRAEAICREYGLDYYIKESLRAEMEVQP